MDQTKVFELKVGVFILIGIMILFIIVFSMGDINVTKSVYRINIIFNFASGISLSAPVRYAGVNVGQIEAIRIIHDPKDNKTKAELKAWVEKGVGIEEDARITINTLGLLGEKYLEIFPGTPGKPLLAEGSTVIGCDPVSMEKVTEELAGMTGSFKAALESVKRVADSAAVVMAGLKAGRGTVGQLLVEEKIYGDLEAFVADIKAHPWKLINKPRGE